MWHLETWVSGGLGNVGLVAGLSHLKGLFQSKSFYDLMILSPIAEVISYFPCYPKDIFLKAVTVCLR